MVTLIEMLEESARRYSNRVALIFERRRVSYRKLTEAVSRLATGLIKLGIKPGEKIGILLSNSPEYVISYFGGLKAGAVIAPLNTFLKTEELRYILADSGVKFLITSSDFLEMMNQLRIRVKSLEKIIIVDKKISGTISFEELLASLPLKSGPVLLPEEVALLLYTSGTTGHPKGVMLTHQNLLSNTLSCARAIRISKRDNFICLLPMFHSFTFTVCILVPLSAGGRVTIVASVRPFKKVIKNILINRVTVLVGIPALYNLLVNFNLPRLFFLFRFLNPLHFCISGAASLPVEVLARFEKKFRLPLLEGYGLTEASPVVSFNPLKGIRKPGSVGLPLPEIEVKVVDKTGKKLLAGEVGELLVKGANVMKGYYNQPEETGGVLREGWLATGDLAKIDQDGYIYIVERKKDMVNVRGLNVYPREVEEILYHHPAVAEAAVIGIKDEEKGEVPIAYIALKEGEKIAEKELLSFCRERIVSYKVPRRIIFKTSLPKTITGKILKKELK